METAWWIGLSSPPVNKRNLSISFLEGGQDFHHGPHHSLCGVSGGHLRSSDKAHSSSQPGYQQVSRGQVEFPSSYNSSQELHFLLDDNGTWVWMGIPDFYPLLAVTRMHSLMFLQRKPNKIGLNKIQSLVHNIGNVQILIEYHSSCPKQEHSQVKKKKTSSRCQNQSNGDAGIIWQKIQCNHHKNASLKRK